MAAVMDRHGRAVPSWRQSNTTDADFCAPAQEDAISRQGLPEMPDRDQGDQFTSYDFAETLRDADIRIAMDGRGRRMDNVMIERIRDSLEYECVRLRKSKTGIELRGALAWRFNFSNNRRVHRAFDGGKPARDTLWRAVLKVRNVVHSAQRRENGGHMADTDRTPGPTTRDS